MAIIRSTIQCPKCSLNISKSNYQKHCNVCKGPKPIPLGRGTTGKTGHNTWHKRLLSGEASAWNKGKTIENNPELTGQLSAGGASFSQNVSNGKTIPGFAVWVQSEKGRKTKSEWAIELHKNDPETHPNRRIANNRDKMTYPEQLIFDLLTNSNIAFEHQKKVNKYYPDFTIGNIIIEVDGDWFHRDKEKEEKRDVILIAEGYEVHHFKVGSKKDLVKRVTEFLISKTLL